MANNIRQKILTIKTEDEEVEERSSSSYRVIELSSDGEEDSENSEISEDSGISHHKEEKPRTIRKLPMIKKENATVAEKQSNSYQVDGELDSDDTGVSHLQQETKKVLVRPSEGSLGNLNKRMAASEGSVQDPSASNSGLTLPDTLTPGGITSFQALSGSITKAVLDAIASKLEVITANTSDLVKSLMNEAAPSIAEMATEKAAKRVKQDQTPLFTKPSNAIQYNVFQEAIAVMDTAAKAVIEADSATALAALSDGKANLQKCQKLIRIADQEKLGWAVVKHYQEDELLMGLDDEKKISRARKAAEEEKISRARKAAEEEATKKKRENTKKRRPSPKSDFRRFRTCYYCKNKGHTISECYKLNGNPRR